MASPTAFTTTSTLDAPLAAVWHVLAVRFGEIDQISDGVAESRYLSEQTEGVGTARRCDLADGGYMEERVTVWEAPSSFELVIDATSMPMEPGGVLTFNLAAVGADRTEIRVDGSYRLARFAFLGPLVRPMFRRTIAGILADLESAAAAG